MVRESVNVETVWISSFVEASESQVFLFVFPGLLLFATTAFNNLSHAPPTFHLKNLTNPFSPLLLSDSHGLTNRPVSGSRDVNGYPSSSNQDCWVGSVRVISLQVVVVVSWLVLYVVVVECEVL